jgi:hypothetical protein
MRGVRALRVGFDDRVIVPSRTVHSDASEGHCLRRRDRTRPAEHAPTKFQAGKHAQYRTIVGVYSGRFPTFSTRRGQAASEGTTAMNVLRKFSCQPGFGSARLHAVAGAGVLACALSGCMTLKVDETRQVAAALQPNEAIVVLKKPQLEGTGTEEDFLDCLQENLGGELVHPEQGQSNRSARAGIPFRIYGEQEFTDALFPWFEPSTAPANANGLKTLLDRPGVSDRLSQIGVRYVVWLDGTTRKTDGGGSVACAAGPGGAGCIGIGWWEKHADYVASIWDLQSALEMGSVTTDVKGTSVLIGALAPIPIISPVRSTACNRLAEQLRSFLVGDDLQGGVPDQPTGGGGTSGTR